MAFHLARAGASVTVYEATRPGAGASGCSFACINALAKRPRFYFEEHRDARRYLQELLRDLDASHLLHLGGTVRWAAGAGEQAQLEGLAGEVANWGETVQWLSARAFAQVEPDLAIPATADVLLLPDEGWLDLLRFSALLLRAAANAGADVRWPDPVVALEPRGGQIHVTSSMESRAFDCAVLAGGPWMSDLSVLGVRAVPVTVEPGLLITTSPLAVDLRHVVYAGAIHVRSDGSGRLMAGSAAIGIDDAPALMSGLGEIVPICRRLAPESVRIGLRAVPRDGLPIVGHLPDEPRIYVASMHSGANLAAHVTRFAAAEILQQQASGALQHYRPERFAADPGLVAGN